jgi:hypothetical protein
MIPTFSGEIQLAGWSESHTGGCKVTFWLQSTEDLEPFRALTVRKGNTAGHRFMAALVEIGDDEQPVQPTVKDSLTHEKPKGGALAKLAGMWCNDPEFFSFIRPIYDRLLGGNGNGHGDVTPDDDFCGVIPEYNAHCIKVFCEINSRTELDHDPVAAEKFHTLIRGPYQKHLIARGIVA